MATLAHPAQRTISPSSARFTHRIGRVVIYALLITVGLVLFTAFHPGIPGIVQDRC
jgi:hypothetical protein